MIYKIFPVILFLLFSLYSNKTIFTDSENSKKNEVAKAGYYRTYLDDYDVNVELTASLRAGFHRYTFKQQKVNLVLDLKHRDKVLESKLNVVNNREIEGTIRMVFNKQNSSKNQIKN